MKKRDFLKSMAMGIGAALLPTTAWTKQANMKQIRTAHIGVGNMGLEEKLTIINTLLQNYLKVLNT